MSTGPAKPDIEAVLDSGADTAYFRLHLDIVIPRQSFIELATLMDAESFEEAETMMIKLRPDAAEYSNLFFSKDLRRRAKQHDRYSRTSTQPLAAGNARRRHPHQSHAGDRDRLFRSAAPPVRAAVPRLE